MAAERSTPIPATRFDLDRWMRTLPQPWTAAMEAIVLARVSVAFRTTVQHEL
jgi:hypothetical protein